MEITVGMTGEATALVEKEDTAQAVGSGSLLVYATPCMVTAVEGKKITFAITASDEAGEIGRATHTRVLVNSEKFLEKTYQKL